MRRFIAAALAAFIGLGVVVSGARADLFLGIPEEQQVMPISAPTPLGSVANSNATANRTITTTAAAGAGGTLVVEVGLRDPSNVANVSVSDDAGNTYLNAGPYGSTVTEAHLFYAANNLALGSGGTITISGVISGEAVVGIASHTPTNLAFDAENEGSGSSDGVTSGNITTAAEETIRFGMMLVASTGSGTEDPGGAYTTIDAQGTSGSGGANTGRALRTAYAIDTGGSLTDAYEPDIGGTQFRVVTLTSFTAVAGGQTLTVPKASFALTGKNVTVNARAALAVGKAGLGLTGQVITVNARALIAIDKAALGVTGRAVQVGAGETIAVGKAALGFTGRGVQVVIGGNTIAVAKGALAFTGQAVVINERADLAIAKGRLAFTGRAIRIPESFRRALFAPQTGAAVLVLLTIEHEQIAPPLRFTSDSVNTASRGETYLAYPFELTLPRRDSQRPSLSRIRIDNVSREIAEKLRAATGPATITAEIVMSSSPDRVEFGPWAWKLRNVSADFFVVEGELEFGSKLLRAWPKQRFTPRTHPGLF